MALCFSAPDSCITGYAQAFAHSTWEGEHELDSYIHPPWFDQSMKPSKMVLESGVEVLKVSSLCGAMGQDVNMGFKTDSDLKQENPH